MAQTPPLSPEWPPTAAQLALLATVGHWQLDDIAYKLPRGDVTRAELDKAADDMEALATLFRRHHPEKKRMEEVMGNSSGAGGSGEMTPKILAEFRSDETDEVAPDEDAEDVAETPNVDTDQTD